MGIAPFEAPSSLAQPGNKIASAMAFLQAAMATGARPASEVEAEALARGIAHSTLQTARERLHIASHRRGHQWIWTPPRVRKPRARQGARQP